ncbi:MAG: HNH endonuclease [Bacteroidota bacterium]
MLKEFNNICEFRKHNPGTRGSGLLVNDSHLDSVKKDLADLGAQIFDKFKSYKNRKLSVEVSQGQTYFPSILHVSLLPEGQAVSNGIYVVICFDINGNGALVGCIESVTLPQGLNTVKRKRRGTQLKIDVDGLRSTTKYNDAFENPREFYYLLEDEKSLLDHIQVSLDLAYYHLGLGDSVQLRIEDKVTAELAIANFDPENLLDGRTRIAKQITARRGQKKFRSSLLEAYNRKCAVTGSDVEAVLEAAHIMPYMGEQTNHVQNGILLRSDIHLLFDLGLLTVQRDTMRIKIHSSLLGTIYYQYHEMKINFPAREQERPHPEALEHHNTVEFKK